jgi:hypothetical protein
MTPTERMAQPGSDPGLLDIGIRRPSQTFRASCGSSRNPVSLPPHHWQRSSWEPSWEPFGADRGGRVWTLVESEAYC